MSEQLRDGPLTFLRGRGGSHFLGHNFFFVLLSCAWRFWWAIACPIIIFFNVKHRTWMVEITCLIFFPWLHSLFSNIFGNWPNYPKQMFILPVTAPSSKKIAHLFPVSFQVPALKISTKGYRQIISLYNINTLPRRQVMRTQKISKYEESSWTQNQEPRIKHWAEYWENWLNFFCAKLCC